jgi:hypothetical protein
VNSSVRPNAQNHRRWTQSLTVQVDFYRVMKVEERFEDFFFIDSNPSIFQNANEEE